MSPEAATLYAALITLGGSLLVVLVQSRLSRRPEQEPPHPSPIPPVVLTRLERVRTERRLRCGCVKHPPLANFEHLDNDCHYSGFYIDLARTVAHTEQLDLEMFAVDWTELPEAFSEMKLDLVLSVFETKARLGYGDFVAAFHKIGIGAVCASASQKVQQVTDLSKPDVRIVVARGEAAWEYAAHELRVPKHRLIVVENSSLPDIMDYVLTGKADVAICDDWSCHEGVSRNLGLRHIFTDDSLYVCKNAIMVPRGDPEFAAWIDMAFSNARLRPEMIAEESRVLATTDGLIRRFR